MIQFSCSDYTFPLLTPPQRFALLKLLGFQYVDLGLFARNTGLQPGQLVADARGFTRHLQTELQRAGLKAADVFLQIGVDPSESAANDPNQLVRAQNRKVFLLSLELCQNLGCNHLTGLPGVWHPHISEAEDLALAQEECAWRQEVAAKSGVTYAVEAHVGSICPDVESARSFVASVPNLTLTLDYGHFVATGEDSKEAHSLLPFASHLHARCGAPGRLQVPIGENEIDFKETIKRLQNREYSGFVTVEYVWTEWQNCNRTDNVSETILLRNMLSEFVNNGRGKAHSEEALDHV